MFGNNQGGSGVMNLDVIVPPLSKTTTYKNAVDLIKLLSHINGSVDIISDTEIIKIVNNEIDKISRYEKLQPFYLQTNRISIHGIGSHKKAFFNNLMPPIKNAAGIIVLQGILRYPVTLYSQEEFERLTALYYTVNESIIGSIYDDYVELYFGSLATIVSANLCDIEIYYYRQPISSGITTANYEQKYIDLPDTFISEIIDETVNYIIQIV